MTKQRWSTDEDIGEERRQDGRNAENISGCAKEGCFLWAVTCLLPVFWYVS